MRENSTIVYQQEALQGLKEIDDKLRTEKVTFEEWEVLFREKLLVERGLLEVMAGITEKPTEANEGRFEEIVVSRATTRPRALKIPAVPVFAAAAALLAFVLRRFGPAR